MIFFGETSLAILSLLLVTCSCTVLATGCSPNNPSVQRVQSNVADPSAFCRFWLSAAHRRNSPFSNLNAAAIHEACSCIASKPSLVHQHPLRSVRHPSLTKGTCAAGDRFIIGIENSVREPQGFCAFWQKSGETRREKSPFANIDARKVSSVCECASKTPALFATLVTASVTTTSIHTTRHVTTSAPTHIQKSTRTTTHRSSSKTISSTNTSPTASKVKVAQTIPSGVDRTSKTLLKPADTHLLAFGSDASSGSSGLSATSDMSFEHPSVILDYSAYIDSVLCKDTQMVVSFADTASRALSLDSWSAKVPVLLVTYSAPCSKDGEMYLFLAKSVQPSGELKMTATGATMALQDAIKEYSLAFGSSPASSAHKRSIPDGQFQTRGLVSLLRPEVLAAGDTTPGAVIPPPGPCGAGWSPSSDLAQFTQTAALSNGSFSLPSFLGPTHSKRQSNSNVTENLTGYKVPPSQDSPWGSLPQLSLTRNGTSLLEQAQFLQATGQILGGFPEHSGIQTSCLDCQGVGYFTITGGYNSTTDVYTVQLEGNVIFDLVFGVDIGAALDGYSAGAAWTSLLPSMQFGSLITFAPQLTMATTLIFESILSAGQIEIGGRFSWSGSISLTTDLSTDGISVAVTGDTVDWRFTSHGAPQGQFSLSSDMHMSFPLNDFSANEKNVYFADTNSLFVQSTGYNSSCGGMKYATLSSGNMSVITNKGDTQVIAYPRLTSTAAELCVPMTIPWACDNTTIYTSGQELWSMTPTDSYQASNSFIDVANITDCMRSCGNTGLTCAGIVWIASPTNNQSCQLLHEDGDRNMVNFSTETTAYTAVRNNGTDCAPGYGRTHGSASSSSTTSIPSSMTTSTTSSTIDVTTLSSSTGATTTTTMTTTMTTTTSSTPSSTAACAQQYVVSTNGTVYDEFSTTRDYYTSPDGPHAKSSFQDCVDYCEQQSASGCVAVVWVKSGQTEQFCYLQTSLTSQGIFPNTIVAYSAVRDPNVQVCTGTGTDEMSSTE